MHRQEGGVILYFLCITTSSLFCQRSQIKRYNYSIPPGVNNIIIPRTEFPLYNKIQVYVKAQNALGQVTTPPLLLDPMEAGKARPGR